MCKKRYLYWWVSFIIGYLFPFTYFTIKLGVTKQVTTVVLPVLILGITTVVYLCGALYDWVRMWRPCFLKGIIKSIPIFVLFIFMITFGLGLKYIMEHNIQVLLNLYFEVVLVVFGSLCISSIFSALHLKYKELDLISKGYTLGVVRNYGR